MGKRIKWVVLVLALLVCPMVASAQSPWTNEEGWAGQAGGKLRYGLTNVLFGWTELFTEPYEAVQNGDNFLMGIGYGAWNGVGQTVGGALHAVTFPLTMVDLPLPEGGTQILQ